MVHSPFDCGLGVSRAFPLIVEANPDARCHERCSRDDLNDRDIASTLPVDPAGPRRASDRDFYPGAILAGRYRIEKYLAAGGMGRVYGARDLMLDVPLALKTIRPGIASDPASLRRFKQEVLLARSVTHPNVCRIFDIGADATTGVTFLTMEFLPGETLAARIKTNGALPTAACLPPRPSDGRRAGRGASRGDRAS